MCLHIRKADNDALRILDQVRFTYYICFCLCVSTTYSGHLLQLQACVPLNYRIHLHCFNGNWDLCQRWLNKYEGCKIGITGLVTYNTTRHLHDVIRRVDLSRYHIDLQCLCSGCPPGNGNNLSNSQACCLAELCLAPSKDYRVLVSIHFLWAILSTSTVLISAILGVEIFSFKCRILLESDAPYMAPDGTDISHPGNTIYIAQRIAQLKGMDTLTIIKATRENIKGVYDNTQDFGILSIIHIIHLSISCVNSCVAALYL